MAAIFGIIGRCSESDLQAMGERLAHKGKHVEVWSPAKCVHFGEVRYWPRSGPENETTASSTQLDVDWRCLDPVDVGNARFRDDYRRCLLSRHIADDPLDGLVHLDGTFAFAHWNPVRALLTLAVDRIGYERIYYAQTSGRFAFASDYKALLALPDIDVTPDPAAMQYAIATSIINVATTLARGIQRVPQAGAIQFDGNNVTAVAYWKPKIAAQKIARKQAANGLKDVLQEQLRRSTAPYEKLALTLSGGLDSAGLLALIRHVHPHKRISTYTIGHSEDDPEIVGARESASYFDTCHTEMLFEPSSIVTDLPRLVWLSEELAGREEAILQYQVERRLIADEDAVMAGHGADMVFAGMPRHRLIRMAEQIPFAKRPLTELFQQTQSGKLPHSLRGRLASWLLYRGGNVLPPELHGLDAPATVFEPDSLNDFVEHTIVEMPEFHFHAAIHSLAPVDALNPYLSNAVIDYSLTLPAHLKSTVFRQKIVLRDALSSLLPDSIRNRRKAIQRVRHNEALTRVLDSMADEYLDRSSVAARGLLSEKYVANVRRIGRSGIYAGDQLSRLWMLLVCEIWCRVFVDNRGHEL